MGYLEVFGRWRHGGSQSQIASESMGEEFFVLINKLRTKLYSSTGLRPPGRSSECKYGIGSIRVFGLK